jgi:long-chain acyl-CoA synthetase
MRCFSPYAALETHAARQSEMAAVILDDKRISYSELLERVTRCANWLRRQGVSSDGVVGICLRDDIAHIVCATALLCLGAPQISLGSHENAATRRQLASKVGATILVVERVEPWMEGLRAIVSPASNLRELTYVPDTANSGALGARPLESVAMFRNTSGSTKVPKTFALSLGRVYKTAEIYANDAKERCTLRSGSVEFDANRLGRICSLLAGNTAVILRRMSASELVAICERASVSMILMGSYKLASLVHEDSGCRRLPSFTAIQTGGSRVSGRLREKIRDLLTHNLWIQYATSEIGLISMALPDQHEEFPEGVGFPDASVTIEIVDRDQNPVKPAEVGEIRLRKESMTTGYLAEIGSTTNFRDGWFYPGDLVSQGTGEPLVFHGRSDDTMLLNSINIFPSAIEDVLESHADVQEAVAYAVKSQIHGEIPVAAVVLSPHARGRNTAHLLEFCRSALGIRAPRQIAVVDHIPRNAVGKPLRRELAQS